jgi:hypothetical protein
MERQMYFLNCWLRNRYRLIVYGVAGCALILLGTLPVTMKFQSGHWVMVHPTSVSAARTAWNDGVDHTELALAALLLFAATDFACLGLGEASGRKEYDFLLTRPRSRRHFVMVAWLAAISQLCLLTVIPSLVAWVTLALLTSRFMPGNMLSTLALFLAAAALIHGCSFAWTMATASVRSGFEFAFVLILMGMVLRIFADSYRYGFFIDLPAGRSARLHDWFINQVPAHWTWSLPLMLAASAVMPFVAHWGFARKNV